MAKISELRTSTSLKVEDLNKKRVNLTISEVEIKEFEGQKKPVLHFEDTAKTFVCNLTNQNMLAMITDSDDTDDWAGWRITLRPDMTQYQGKPMPCIRVDAELPPQKPKTKAPVIEDEGEDEPIPF